MLLPIEDLRVGMHTGRGEVMEIVDGCFVDGERGYRVWIGGVRGIFFPRKNHIEVTEVLAKHLQPGMVLSSGETIRFTNGEGGKYLWFKSTSRSWTCPSNTPFPLQTEVRPVTIGLDAQKHLEWAVQNKDWPQARAALTELEKKA